MDMGMSPSSRPIVTALRGFLDVRIGNDSELQSNTGNHLGDLAETGNRLGLDFKTGN
jgi:hypothetical protein